MTKKRIGIITIVLLILGTTYFFLYTNVNKNTPKKVNVSTYQPGEFAKFEDVAMTVKYEISNQPFEGNEVSPKVYKYLKLYVTIKNHGSKEINPAYILDKNDLRIGNQLIASETKGEISKIQPYESKTYLKYSALTKEDVKYGVYYSILPTLQKSMLLSKEEQKQVMLNPKEWVVLKKEG